MLAHLKIIMNNNNLKESGDPERLDITFGGTALHAAVASNEDDQAREMINMEGSTIHQSWSFCNEYDQAREINFVESSTNQQFTNHAPTTHQPFNNHGTTM